MKITKAELRKIILEEHSIAKEGMDVEQDLELQTKTVLNNGGGIQDVGTAIEKAGYKVRRTNSVILVDTPDGTYGIASTSKVDLDGTEAIIQGIGGTELAIGRMSQ